ncbi:MAG: ATP phosphoribosyltransferase [Methanomicrobiales archaeon]|nr:ATP phosphoribosyltransferase [Methanomicrobiales archaeon]
MSSPPSEKVRLAIPSKGRIAAPARELLEKSGLRVGEGSERRLLAGTSDPHVEMIFARPADIPEYVANGIADLGITGQDMVRERGVTVDEILDLRFGAARLVLAVPEESRVRSAKDLRRARIATEFPRITREFFDGKGVEVSVVHVGGACEATPHLGIADAIVDLTASGDTLRTHHLRVVEEVLSTSTHLIGNPASRQEKGEKMDEVALALESVVRARGQCYLMMNISRRALPRVRKVLPGLSGPTVMDVASDEDLVAVHAVVEEDRIYALITLLKREGARDILVMPIDRMVR